MTALKTLEGTEKQVAWAETIRAKAIAQAQVILDHPVWQKAGTEAYRIVAEEAFARLCRQDMATWWIDHRYQHGEELLTYFAAKYKAKMKAEGKGEMFQHPNQFMRPTDRTPLDIRGATIY